MSNRVRLNARLVSRADLRFSPSGVAVLQAGLHHRAAVAEAGVERQLDFELEAIALGDAARRLDRQALGTELDIDGFLAPRSRRSRTLIVHIIEFKTI